MPEKIQQIEEGEGLSTGAQLGIAAFFVGLPFLGMGIEALGWGETGLVLAALGAGGIGYGTKLLIDHHREDSREIRPNGRASALSRFALHRLSQANWGALLRPLDEGQGESASRAQAHDVVFHRDDMLNLGPTLRPHADSALSGRKVILGTSGSGKTNNMNVYCEEIAKLDPAPAIILFDTDDENRAICDARYFPRPMWLDKSLKLTPGNAFDAAQTIMTERYQCVINLQSYEDEEAAWIMINMIKGVRAWQEAREVREPCEIVLDEASVWLPQNQRESLLSSVMVDDPDVAQTDNEESEEEEEEERGRTKKISLLSLLQRAFFSTVVRRGRRRGMGFTLAAQRIAEIDKRALQGSWMFLMRQTQPADFREYQKYGISPQEAMGLRDGEAYVFAPGKPREKHRFRESRSPHGGITPGMKELRHEGAQVPTQTLKQSDERTYSFRSITPRRHTKAINQALQMAYDAYQPGMTQHDLAKDMGVKVSVAGSLLKQLREHGWIDVAGKKMVSLSPVKVKEAKNHAQDLGENFIGENGEMAVKSLQEPGETKAKEGEIFTVSSDDEIAILKAAYHLQFTGASVTREAIKGHLGWNNKKHDIVKAVCDKHGIAMR